MICTIHTGYHTSPSPVDEILALYKAITTITTTNYYYYYYDYYYYYCTNYCICHYCYCTCCFICQYHCAHYCTSSTTATAHQLCGGEIFIQRL
jgi:hypothetical protein